MKIIYQNNEGGISIIHPTGELSIEEVAAKDVPQGVAYEIVEDDAIPADRFFRSAWVANGAAVAVDLGKAKDIGHDIRRTLRTEEFKPYDEVIMKQIPGVDAVAAEEARQQVRFKYALIQDAINVASTTDEIKAALEVN